MKFSRLKKANNLDELNRLALDATGNYVTITLADGVPISSKLNTVIYQNDGSITLELDSGSYNSSSIVTFSTDEGDWVNLTHDSVNPYNDNNIWNY